MSTLKFVAQHLDYLDAVLRSTQPVVRYDQVREAIDGKQLAHHLRAGTGCNNIEPLPTVDCYVRLDHARVESGDVEVGR